MKKTLYTLSIVALFSLAARSQSAADPAKKEPAKKETVNPDGTVAPAKAEKADAPVAPGRAEKPVPVENAKSDNAQPAAAPAPAPATAPRKDRHAITEKGVPASKSKDTKEQKTTEKKKAQPATTENH